MKEELIRYRQKKARDTLEDAALLFQSGRLFSALNRIYYALFYKVKEWLDQASMFIDEMDRVIEKELGLFEKCPST
jgi:hypothetical protein